MNFHTPVYLGVVGKPAFHSLSPAMHSAAMRKLGIQGTYLAFEVDNFKEAVIGAMRLGFRGLNVTIPYKEDAYRIADETSEEARAVKAANTILFENERIKVFNTDIYGFSESLKKIGFEAEGKSVAVIGAGGASRAIVYALIKLKAKRITIFNRNREKALRLKEDMDKFSQNIETRSIEKVVFEEFDMVVNATDLGWKGENVFDAIGSLPRKRGGSDPERLFYDTVYIPTPFQRIAGELGYKTADGRWMLVLQGAMSFKIWTSIYPDERAMFLTVTRRIIREKR